MSKFEKKRWSIKKRDIFEFLMQFSRSRPSPVFPLSHTEHAVTLNLHRIYYLTFHCNACTT